MSRIQAQPLIVHSNAGVSEALAQSPELATDLKQLEHKERARLDRQRMAELARLRALQDQD